MSLVTAAALGPSAYWYLTRGTGAVALVLLTVSVVIGIAGSLRVTIYNWPRFAIDAVHRDVSLLAIVLLAVHIVTSVLDGFAPISLTAAVIPFISSYRPFWLGLGALAFDLLLAIAITSLVRRRLGYQRWRAIHWLAYASWPIAVLHGLGTGTDTKVWWMLAAHRGLCGGGGDRRLRADRVCRAVAAAAAHAGVRAQHRRAGRAARVHRARPAREGMGPARGHPGKPARADARAAAARSVGIAPTVKREALLGRAGRLGHAGAGCRSGRSSICACGSAAAPAAGSACASAARRSRAGASRCEAARST